MMFKVNKFKWSPGVCSEPVPLLCCGLTWDRSNIRRKSFFSSMSGVLFICSAVYGVVRGAGAEGGEGVFLLQCAGGGERLHSLISLLLFLLFCARRSSRRVSVVRPHTRRKSIFFEGRNICESHNLTSLYLYLATIITLMNYGYNF